MQGKAWSLGVIGAAWLITVLTAVAELGNIRVHLTMTAASLAVTLWVLTKSTVHVLIDRFLSIEHIYQVVARSTVQGLVEASVRQQAPDTKPFPTVDASRN